MPSPFLEAALAAIERGHTVFPIRDKQPLTRFVNGDPAASLASTPEQAARMAKRFPGATGAGIKLRADQGVFDCDTEAALQWSLKHLPKTYAVHTGRESGSGAHFYLTLPSRLRHNPRLPVPGLEFKTLGGYVVAPGSVHKSGSVYTEYPMPVAEIPRALAKQIGPPRPSQDDDASPDELAAWAAVKHDEADPLYRLARQLALDEVENVYRFLNQQLPEGDEWGNKFFGQAVHLGRWVGQGILTHDYAAELLDGVFDRLDDGRGGAKGEAHIRRSIRRGLAAGARKAQP